MKIELKDKNALVGASSQGIGLAIARELAQCGANITLMARDEMRMEQIFKQLPKIHPNQHHGYLKVDFSDFQAFNTNITVFFENHTIDILVNNTNGPRAGKATELGIDEYQQAFDLLFKSVCQTVSS